MWFEGRSDFNAWLRDRLKARKMSQRQLAQQSGVDHSTISRLVRGDRIPSLETATKLALGLRAIDDPAGSRSLRLVVGEAIADAGGGRHPAAGVEYALRSDEELDDGQVRQVMEFYLAVRAGRGTGSSGRPGVDLPEVGPRVQAIPPAVVRRARPAERPEPPAAEHPAPPVVVRQIPVASPRRVAPSVASTSVAEPSARVVRTARAGG